MKEQVQRLGGTPSVAAQTGQFGTTVTPLAAAPVQIQAPTSGQKLAQALGIVVDTGIKIGVPLIEDANEQEAAHQTIEGTLKGQRYALDVLNESRKLPEEERSAYIRGKMETSMQELKNGQVSKAYLKSYLGAFSVHAGEYDRQVNESVYKNNVTANQMKTANAIPTLFEQHLLEKDNLAKSNAALDPIALENMKATSTSTYYAKEINRIKAANPSLTTFEAGQLYFKSMSAYITEQQRLDPKYNGHEILATLANITTEDGIRVGQNVAYKTEIDSTRATLTAINTQRYETEKLQRAETKQQTQSMIVNMALAGKTPTEINKFLEKHTVGWTLKEITDTKEEIKNYNSVVYPKQSDIKVYSTLDNKALSGTLTDKEIMENKEFLSYEDSKKLHEATQAAKESFKDAKSAAANDAFKAAVTAGAGATGQDSVFNMTKEGQLRRDVFNRRMYAFREEHLKANQYKHMYTTTDIFKWEEEAMKAAFSKYPSTAHEKSVEKSNATGGGTGGGKPTPKPKLERDPRDGKFKPRNQFIADVEKTFGGK